MQKKFFSISLLSFSLLSFLLGTMYKQVNNTSYSFRYSLASSYSLFLGTLYKESQNDSQSLNGVITHGQRDSKKIALTFDAEMTQGMKDMLEARNASSSIDQRIIETLTKTNTKATIFLTGMWIEMYPQETKLLADNHLFEIGSHSYADYSFAGNCYGLPKISHEQTIEQVGATELLLKTYAGVQNKLFRFPGGCYSEENLQTIKATGDIVVHWDVSGDDGFTNDTQQIIKNVVDCVQNGSIIILHLNGSPTAPKTADALPTIITTLKKRGYLFVKISELLHLSEIQQGQNTQISYMPVLKF